MTEQQQHGCPVLPEPLIGKAIFPELSCFCVFAKNQFGIFASISGFSSPVPLIYMNILLPMPCGLVTVTT